MNSQHPSHLNDNPPINNDRQPSSANTTRSDNFIDTSEAGLFDFDLEDLENFFNASAHSTTPPSADTSPNTPSTPSPSPTHAHDITSMLPALDLSPTPSHPYDTAPAPQPLEQKANVVNLEKSWETQTPTSISAISTPETSAPNTLHEPVMVADSMIDTPTKAEPPITPTSSGNGSNTPPPALMPIKKPRKNNKSLLILLGVLGAGALAWLASQLLSDPEPAATPQPLPAPKAVSATAASTPNSGVAVTSATTTTAPAISSPAASSSPLATKTIQPEAILASPLPKDNAVAKEEIDRLADQSKQLSQQEKMMEEQLKMMNELSNKKEERIALLEKQIAQIEAQKAAAKK